MRKINVIQCTGSMRAGGGERVVAELLMGLPSQSYRMLGCITSEGILLEELLKRQIKMVIIRRIRCNPTFIYKLFRLFRSQAAQIVHAHLPMTSFYATVAARLAKVPVVLVSEHGNPSLLDKRYQMAEKLTARLVDAFVAVSRFGRDSLITDWGVAPNKVKIIPNGVDINKFSPELYNRNGKNLLGVEDSTPVVGIVGGLRPVKNHVSFLTAASLVKKALPDTKFVIVGDGIMRQQLETQAASLGIQSEVLFLGDRRDIPQLLVTFDVVVNSSLSEGLAVSIMEAMAMEKPVVATNVGGNSELIEDGQTGILVPPGDVQALAESIKNLLADKNKIREFGKKARQRVLDKFSLQRMVQNHDILYRNLLAQKSQKR